MMPIPKPDNRHDVTDSDVARTRDDVTDQRADNYLPGNDAVSA